MARFLMVLIIVITLFFGCSTITPQQITLNTLTNYTSRLSYLCGKTATNHSIYYSSWITSVKPKLAEIEDLTALAYKESWSESQIRAEILPKVKVVHNEVYDWGMRIVETKIS